MVSIWLGEIPRLLKQLRAVGGISTMMCSSISRRECIRPDGKKALPVPSNSIFTIASPPLGRDKSVCTKRLKQNLGGMTVRGHHDGLER